MSFRRDSRSKRSSTTNRRDRREKSSTASTSVGERAWDYLLRRKAEDINDRIYKTKAVGSAERSTEDLKTYYSSLRNIKTENLTEIPRDEHDIDGFPLEATSTRDYVPNEGFWIDRARESRDQWIGAGVESGYDETATSGTESCYYENKDPWREATLKTHGLTSRHLVKQEQVEDLRETVCSYIEDVRHDTENLERKVPADSRLDSYRDSYHGARQNHIENSPEQTSFYHIPGEISNKNPITGYHYKNYPYETSDYGLPNDRSPSHQVDDVHFMLDQDQVPKDNFAKYPYETSAYDTSYGGNLSHHASDSTLNYAEDSYQASRHTYGGNMPDGTAHRSSPSNKEHRHLLSDNNLMDSTLNYVEESSQAARALLMDSMPDVGDDRHVTRNSYETKLSEQTANQHRPNDADDLRHLINKKSRRYSAEGHPCGQSLTHSTSDSYDAHFPIKQSSDLSKSREGNCTSIHTLPYPADGVDVVYTTDPVEVEAWLRNNVIDCFAEAVGFDIEWKPQFKSKKKGGVENKTAVLQLAVESSCLVCHFYYIRTPPKVLASVLSDEKISKIGSGILQDVAKLKKDTGLKCIGLVDTQKMAKSIGIPESQKLGLKSLAKGLLGIEIEKPKSVAMSNWEKFPLTFRQIHYAALDAWIGLKIYQHLSAMPGVSNLQEKSYVVNCEDVEKSYVPISCQVCGKKGIDSVSLSNHMEIHSKCKCGQYFVAKISKKHLKECPVLNPPSERHVHQTHADEPGLCHGCGKKCRSLKRLMEHIKEVGHVACPFCSRLLHHSASFSHISKCQNFISEEWKQIAM